MGRGALWTRCGVVRSAHYSAFLGLWSMFADKNELIPWRSKCSPRAGEAKTGKLGRLPSALTVSATPRAPAFLSAGRALSRKVQVAATCPPMPAYQELLAPLPELCIAAGTVMRGNRVAHFSRHERQTLTPSALSGPHSSPRSNGAWPLLPRLRAGCCSPWRMPATAETLPKSAGCWTQERR